MGLFDSMLDKSVEAGSDTDKEFNEELAFSNNITEKELDPAKDAVIDDKIEELDGIITTVEETIQGPGIPDNWKAEFDGEKIQLYAIVEGVDGTEKIPLLESPIAVDDFPFVDTRDDAILPVTVDGKAYSLIASVRAGGKTRLTLLNVEGLNEKEKMAAEIIGQLGRETNIDGDVIPNNVEWILMKTKEYLHIKERDAEGNYSYPIDKIPADDYSRMLINKGQVVMTVLIEGKPIDLIIEQGTVVGVNVFAGYSERPESTYMNSGGGKSAPYVIIEKPKPVVEDDKKDTPKNGVADKEKSDDIDASDEEELDVDVDVDDDMKDETDFDETFQKLKEKAGELLDDATVIGTVIVAKSKDQFKKLQEIFNDLGKKVTIVNGEEVSKDDAEKIEEAKEMQEHKKNINGNFYSPVEDIDISTVWGRSTQSKAEGDAENHNGVDIKVKERPVRSSFAGTVVRVDNEKYGYGNHIIIKHEPINGVAYMTLYAHLKKLPAFNSGDKVSTNTFLGVSGNTGEVESDNGGDGYHLHYEIRVEDPDYNGGLRKLENWKPIDPKEFSYLISHAEEKKPDDSGKNGGYWEKYVPDEGETIKGKDEIRLPSDIKIYFDTDRRNDKNKEYHQFGKVQTTISGDGGVGTKYKFLYNKNSGGYTINDLEGNVLFVLNDVFKELSGDKPDGNGNFNEIEENNRVVMQSEKKTITVEGREYTVLIEGVDGRLFTDNILRLSMMLVR